MLSLRQRFNRFLSLGLLLIFALQWGAAVFVLDKSTDAYVISRLRHDLESLLLALDDSEDGLPILNLQKLNPVFERPFSGHYYHLRSQGLDFYSRSLWNQALPIPELLPGAKTTREWPGPKGQKLMIYSAHYQHDHHSIEIAVAEDLTPLQHNIWRFTWGYALLSLLLLLLMLGLQTWLLRYSLRPLTQMQGELQALAQGERQHLSEAAPAEIRPLIQKFNRLLQVLDQRLQRSRHTLANLAHALKKPLALMHRSLEDLSPEFRQDLSEHLEQIQHLIEHELRRGRLAGAAPSGEQIQLSQELPVLLQLLERSYPDKKLHLIQDFPPGHRFTGDRQDLLELCGNLLDNAFKWAQDTIWVQISDRPGLELTIDDDGPGCPPELCEHLLQRGTRLDRSKPGHGFGLAIAQEIVQAYGGELRLQPSELGGLQVKVILPPTNRLVC